MSQMSQMPFESFKLSETGVKLSYSDTQRRWHPTEGHLKINLHWQRKERDLTLEENSHLFIVQVFFFFVSKSVFAKTNTSEEPIYDRASGSQFQS